MGRRAEVAYERLRFSVARRRSVPVDKRGGDEECTVAETVSFRHLSPGGRRFKMQSKCVRCGRVLRRAEGLICLGRVNSSHVANRGFGQQKAKRLSRLRCRARSRCQIPAPASPRTARAFEKYATRSYPHLKSVSAAKAREVFPHGERTIISNELAHCYTPTPGHAALFSWSPFASTTESTLRKDAEQFLP